MPRLKETGRENGFPYSRAVFDQLFGEGGDPLAPDAQTQTGTPGNWWTVFNTVPDAFAHTTDGFRFYRSPDRVLSARDRELGQTRAGYAVGSRFVFSQHCKAARAAGLSPEQVDAIPHWSAAPDGLFSAADRALLAYTDCLVLERGRVPEALFAALKSHFSDEELLEFTYITCTYMMHAVMSRALRLEYDDVDEPCTEVPAPEGFDEDVMGMVDR